MNVGQKIRQLREDKDITQRDLSKTIGLNVNVLCRIELGTRPVRDDELVKISKALNVSIDELLGVENKKAKTYKIPVYSQVGAGEDYLANNDIVDWEEIPIKYKNLGDFFGVKIRGDSMEPAFKDGGVLVVKSQNDVDSGDLAIVLVNGFEGTFKKVIKSDKGITLVAFNTNVYLPHFYSYDDVRDLPVRILGKVVQYRLNL